MKNFFSLKLYIEGLRKIKVAGVASAITVIALNALLPIIGIIESNMVMPGQVRTVSTVETLLFAPFGLLMMVFAVVLTYAMFSYLNERSKSDFWHAIPDKRTCVYFSFIAAIYTWIAAILLVSGLVNLALWNIAKYYTAGFLSFLGTFGMYFLAATMLVGFMTLAMTLTGTTVSNVLILALLFLFVRAVGGLFTACVYEVAPMFDISYSILRVFELDFFLPFSLVGDLYSVGQTSTFSDVPLILYSVATSLLLLGLGAVGYVRRKSEMATHSAPSKLVQHIYRVAVTLPFCLLLVYLLLEYVDASLVAIMVIVILLVWVIFELMTTKKIKNVLKSLPVLVVPLVLSLLFTGAVFATRNAIWEDTPDADEIRGVSLEGYGNSTYERVMTSGIAVEDKELSHLVSEALESTVEVAKNTNRDYIGSRRHVVIHLKSGRTMGRYVSMDDKAYTALLNGFYNSAEYRSAYLSMPTSKQIESIGFSNFGVNKQEAKRLWASYLQEYSQLSDEEKYAVKSYRSYDGITAEYLSYDEAVGYVYLYGQVGVQSFSSEYPILYRYMPETAEMYLEYYNRSNGISGATATDSIEILLDTATQANLENSTLYGSVRREILYGVIPLDSVDYVYMQNKEKNTEALLDLLEFLSNVEAIDDYEAEPGKSILILRLSLETNMEWKEDPNLSFDGKEIVAVDYVYVDIPVALTKSEAVEFEALWTAFVDAQMINETK